MMRRKWENYGVKLEIAKRDLAEKGSLIKIIRPGKIRAEGDRTLRFTEPNRTLVKRDSYRTEPNRTEQTSKSTEPNNPPNRTIGESTEPNPTEPNHMRYRTEPKVRFGRRFGRKTEGSVEL